MARYALLIDYDYCTGCQACEVACQQEHGYPVGTNGVTVREHEYVVGKRVKIDFLPFLTDHCDFCTARLQRSEALSGEHHVVGHLTETAAAKPN